MKTIQDYPTINERPPEGLKGDGTAFKVTPESLAGAAETEAE